MRTKNFFLTLLITAMMCVPFTANAQVTIGSTELPEAMLDIRAYPQMSERGQGFRLIDGNHDVPGRVLTLGEDGVGTWRYAGISRILGTRGTGNIDFPLMADAPTMAILRQTGTSITLPPGMWEVQVSVLMGIVGMSTSIANALTANDFAWVRGTFSDSPIAVGTTSEIRTADFIGPGFISGDVRGPVGHLSHTAFGIKSGSMILNNTSGANKTYYFVVGNFNTRSNFTAQEVVLRIMPGGGESTIVAVPVIDID